MAQLDHLSQSLLCIDRLTLLFKTPHLSLWTGSEHLYHCQSCVDCIHKIFGDDVMIYQNPTELFYYHIKHSAGYDIQIGPRMPKVTKNPSDVELALSFGCCDRGFVVPQVFGLRIEFNPNSVSAPFSVLSPLFKYYGFSDCQSLSDVRVSRIDVAIDYPFELNPCLILCRKTRKSFLACGSSGIESVYFGSRASSSYFRIYNKKLEIQEKTGEILDHPLWRVELEYKNSFFLCDTPDLYPQFDRLSFYQKPCRTGDWVLDLVYQQAQENGLKSVLQLMPEATRKRWVKILSEYSIPSLLPPCDVFVSNFQSCFDSLRSQICLALGFDLVDSSLYKDSSYGREY